MEIREIIDQIIQESIDAHASDIFILPKDDCYHIDIRSGVSLSNLRKFSLSEGMEAINYFKYIAQMDISEHRRPQVGAMTYLYQNDSYYLRLSSLGDFNDAESLVIRIIYQIDHSSYFFPEQLTELAELSFSRGLILTSGPTGSGKTTTMYELAKNVGRDSVVMTIEDPVEVHEGSFLQTQVNNEAGIDYFSLLKAALRHRPDILIIGEIRDPGTARLAVDAALSGHLVLATLHAKSTLQTIARLEGLNISRSELLNCLTAVSYQRLLPDLAGNFSCLMDIASGDYLKEQILCSQRVDFVNWQENLKQLREEGRIDDHIFDQFKKG